ncbi:phage tail tape measure protein [Cronobacter malonaticus]|uniref:phage tail tape measure protein n=1 Tax=Cronobacter malonaticus TaxID=413503 RepID=UPI00188AD38E|nr:phage tail tape measure protein [Cronobacter malonaticus]MBF4661202.1 phage tail tape measure protein [Cronobacter malonaticus]MBF4836083.1 phage tail tape measure protein [Cronobacter malonaticus]MBF4846260.1 phage tail tape measure protein [Cronobacter malonaticus]MBF4848684.1 phage tail tape measure protein [Cronobacter malonaticus]MBF4860285.1 phage tail tape measure protein [Cronobacter malonaticus]
MATLRELIIKISANSQSFQSEISRASRMGSDYYKTMEQGGRRAASATRETQRSLGELNAQLASVRASAASMAGAFAGAFATGQLIHYADTWNQLNGRLRLASSSAQDFTTAQQSLMSISQRTGTSFEANANLYSRIAQSLRDAGYASADVANVTETVATSLKLSGASTEEASSVITQLSQALGSGVLRGEEFNAIMESGGRLAKFLADGLNTTIGGLRNMANNGELTTDKIVPLLTNVAQLRKEFDTLPASISGSAQKVENAFMAWVGGANDATGASAALAGVLNGLANNIDNVAAAGAVLAGVGVAKYFGGITTGVSDSITKLVSIKKETIALADAQLYSATQSQRKAVAAAEAARSDYALAVAEANVAKNTNASVIASQNLIKKRSEMMAANASLVLSNRAVTTAQESLNKATSLTSFAKSGLSGALSVIGGWPGALMAVGAAWLYVYEKNEQARKAALDYGEAIKNAKPLSGLLVAQSNNAAEIDKTAVSMRAQAEEIEKLNSNIAELTQQQFNARQAMKSNEEGSWSYNRAQEALVQINDELNQAEKQRTEISQQLSATTDRHNALLGQAAAAQNKYYDSLVRMTGQGALFRQTLEDINEAMFRNASIAAVPLRIPQAPVSDKDQETLLRKQQQAELAGLTGLARVRRQAEIELQNMGRTGPQNATYAADYLKAAERDYQNSQNVAAAQKAQADATRDAGKAARAAAQTTEQYSRKMADLSVATEVQKVRANQGEKAAELFAASHEAGAKWSEEQRKSIEAGAVALAQWTQKADEAVRKQHEMADALKDLKDAGRRYRDESDLTSATSGMGNRQREQYRERQEVERVFDKTDKGAEAIAARQSALDALDKKYQQAKASELDWRAGVSAGLSDWMDNVSNIVGTVSQGITSTMDSALDNVSAMLVGNKASWKDWGLSVLQTISKVALQMAVVNAMGGGSSGSGLLGSLLGGIVGGVAGSASGGANAGTAIQNYGASFQFNAKGGVYSSADLSSYSGSVVDTPTFFAFAKGAGVMGEAGPEAIMPLTRDATGRLGVKALGSGTQGGAGVSVSIGTINFSGGAGGAQGNANAAGAVANQLTGAILDTINTQLRKPGTPLWNATQGKR